MSILNLINVVLFLVVMTILERFIKGWDFIWAFGAVAALDLTSYWMGRFEGREESKKK